MIRHQITVYTLKNHTTFTMLIKACYTVYKMDGLSNLSIKTAGGNKSVIISE